MQLEDALKDEVVASLATSWIIGRKTLVFVRRVASVKEIKQKLDELYDKWLTTVDMTYQVRRA